MPQSQATQAPSNTVKSAMRTLDIIEFVVAHPQGPIAQDIAAALHRLPPTIPEVNREAWAALARTAANLNQIAHRLNAGDALPLAEVRATLDAFRRDLIGVKHDAEDVEDESEG